MSFKENSMEERIYCGSGKCFGQYGQIGIDICIDEIPKEFIKKANNGKSYVKLNVCKKKSQDQYGNSHYVAVNTWKKDGGQSSTNNSLPENNNTDATNIDFENLEEPINPDDVPF